jgi:hypothetical protein
MTDVTTRDLLRALVSREARRRMWELNSPYPYLYEDSDDERILSGVIDALAMRINLAGAL